MPSIDGGPQEDPRWNEPEEVSPVEKKFDFENIDIKLYLALKNLMSSAMHMVSDDVIEAASLACEEFELSHGPLPDWAVGRNWSYELMPGAQLLTKDGRRTGNAHIIRLFNTAACAGAPDKLIYDCITDAGSELSLSASELEEMFHIGDWISDVKRVLRDFDREGHFDTQGE